MAISKDSLYVAQFSESELLDMRNVVRAQLLSDPSRQVVSISSPGLSATYTISASPTELLEAIGFALSKLNPCLYGNKIQSRTTAYFP
jgi:hypothetical protein